MRITNQKKELLIGNNSFRAQHHFIGSGTPDDGETRRQNLNISYGSHT